MTRRGSYYLRVRGEERRRELYFGSGAVRRPPSTGRLASRATIRHHHRPYVTEDIIAPLDRGALVFLASWTFQHPYTYPRLKIFEGPEEMARAEQRIAAIRETSTENPPVDVSSGFPHAFVEQIRRPHPPAVRPAGHR